MAAYLLDQKPSLARPVRPQDPLVLPSGAFLALISFLRLCLDKERSAGSSNEQHGDHVPQLLGAAQGNGCWLIRLWRM